MGNYTYMQVGDELEVMAWKWVVPTDPFLSFIFKESDKVVCKISPLPEGWEEDYEPYECFYETTVGAVKDRLERLNLSVEQIDSTITRHLGVPPEMAPLAADLDSFYDLFPEPTDGSDEEYAAWEHLSLKLDEVEDAVERFGLGYLPQLRHIHEALKRHEDNEKVRLAFDGTLDVARTPNDFDSLRLFAEYESEMHLERKYLTMARVHFTTHEFNLVFIELSIALETAIKDLVTSACKTRNIDTDVERLFLRMGLMDMLRFATMVLPRVEVDRALIDKVVDVYNKRNNIIHGGARRFTISETADAIRTIEEIILRLNTTR